MVTYSKWDSKKVIQVFEVKTTNCMEKANHVHVVLAGSFHHCCPAQSHTSQSSWHISPCDTIFYRNQHRWGSIGRNDKISFFIKVLRNFWMILMLISRVLLI